jgi:hypothetical protein
VSQLKRHLPATQPVSDDLALLCLDDFALLQPQEVLARRLIQRGSAVVPRVLVRWLGLPNSQSPGKMKTLSVVTSLQLRIGVKPALKRGRMSRPSPPLHERRPRRRCKTWPGPTRTRRARDGVDQGT